MTDAFFFSEIIRNESGEPYDYRFLEVNPAYEIHTGVKREQLLGKTLLEVYPNASPISLKVYREVALSGQSTHYEVFSLAVNNKYLDVYAFSPEKEKLAVIFKDITESKRLEEQVRQRAEELEMVMEVAPVAVWIGHDPRSQNITGNRMANELFEAEVGENVSANITPVRRFFHKGRELTADEMPMHQAALGDIDVRNAEFDVLLPSGKWRALLGSASPLHDADGSVRGSVGTFIDITEHKKAEEATSDSESARKVAEAIESERKRLFDVLETLPVMICLLTPDHYVTFANRTCRSKFGDEGGRYCYEYCYGYSRPCEFCETYKVLETGQPHHWEINNPDGSINMPMVSRSPMLTVHP